MIVTKFYSDLKSKLEVRKVRFASGAKVTIFGQLGLDVRQMYQLSQYGVFVMRDRVSKAIGSDDAPMPGLKKGYSIQKGRAGRSTKRNLDFSGDMLNNISVRSVSATQGRIDITSAKQRIKARANERKAPWWGWSPQDLAKLASAARFLFGMNLSFGVGSSARGKAFGSSAIWLDPMGQQKGGTVTALPKAA